MRSFYSTLFLLVVLPVCSMGQIQLRKVFHWEVDSITPSQYYKNDFNETWGFVQDGVEYAVIGSSDGTHIFDISDTTNIYQAAFVWGKDTGKSIVHRDYHDYKGYLYAVSDEGSSSLQIMDLSYLPDSVSVVYDSDVLIRKSHNIFIDTAKGKLYTCGGNSNNGIRYFDLSVPTNPVEILNYTTSYTHDIFVRNDTGYLNQGNSGMRVFNFADSVPQELAHLSTYTDEGYNHSGWLNKSGNLYAMADETAGKRVKLLDVSDLGNIEEVSLFYSDVDTLSMVHNLIFKDSFLFVAHYHDGLYVYNVSDPENPALVDFYDTSTEPHNLVYRGAWGVYPLFESGLISVSDMQNGLWIFELEGVIPTANQENTTLKPRIFPNPVASNLHVSVGKNWVGKEYLIYSNQGALVAKGNIQALMHVINTEHLQTGVYHLTIENENIPFIKK